MGCQAIKSSKPAGGDASRGSALAGAQNITAAVLPETLITITSEGVVEDLTELHKLFQNRFDECPDGDIFVKTLCKVVDILAGGVGSTIIAVIHNDVMQHKPLFSTLDNGLHTEFFKQVAPNIHHDAFKVLLTLLTAHNDSDRWEPQELVEMVHELPETAELVGKLADQPKDGAMVFNHKGDVIGISLHLKHPSNRLQLVKADGRAGGTGHAGALGFAEWLGAQEPSGIVFKRSDGGGALAFCPDGDIPKVWEFPTLRIPTQEDMLKQFRDRIKQHGTLKRKTAPVLARPARNKEHVVTLFEGQVKSDVTISDDMVDTHMVVRFCNVDQELMVRSRADLEKTYDMPGVELTTLLNSEWSNKYFLESDTVKLMERGYRLCWPKGNQDRWLYSMTNEDVALLPTKSFVTVWNAVQAVSKDTLLALLCRKEGRDEIYVMNPEQLEFYEDVVAADNTSKTGYLTQAEMLTLFAGTLEREGKFMERARPATIRKAMLGESIVTCIDGRITSTQTVSDDTSFVVRGAQCELYVLSKEKMEAHYESTGSELPSKTPIDKMLISQGFKHHRPKSGNGRLIYQLKASDLERIPNGTFHTAWGVPQTVKEGDSIAMAATSGTDKDIYHMPPLAAAEFESVGSADTICRI